MEFDEWWDENKDYIVGMSAEAALRRVWYDATHEERERCANVVEGVEFNKLRRAVADMIRQALAKTFSNEPRT